MRRGASPNSQTGTEPIGWALVAGRNADGQVMSEKIEQVAKAIHASNLLQPANGPWPDHETVTKAFCREAARAAIEAMREPTKEMLEAAYAVGGVSRIRCTACWVTMIVAALYPKTATDL